MKDLQKILNNSIKLWHGREHYKYQRKITHAIIDGIEKSRSGEETVEIPIELPRQSGKTTAVVDTVEFILAAGVRYFGKPLAIGIFAPEKEQASTDFDRLKMQYLELAKLGFSTKVKTKTDLKFPQKWNSKTIRLFDRQGRFLGEVYIFPITKTSHPESKTLDVIIIEETQDVDDDRMKKAVFPMGASTNALRVYVGTAGNRICYFKKQIDSNPRKIIIPLEEVFSDRQEMFNRSGDNSHLLYKKFVDHEIKENGIEDDYIQTQYYLKWIIGSGQFTTAEDIDALVGNFGLITENRKRILKDKDGNEIKKDPYPVFIGIDTAKHPDKTVVTALRNNEDLPKVKKKDEAEVVRGQICNWLVLRGENYEDQFEIITDWLKRFDNILGIGIDATGQGDFMPDKFERHTGYNIKRVKFTVESKDVIYKILSQVIKNKLTLLPNIPDDPTYREFRQELLDLQKKYKGRFMSVSHPEAKGAHDDFSDSWAIAEYVKAEFYKHEPSINII